ncbi:MAG: hypothetical protein ACRBN8_16335 [Nannocystales bacterium]
MRAEDRRRRGLIWAAAAVLVGVHVWSPSRGGIVAGVLPWDLAFHLGWMLAAGLLVEALTRTAWRDVDGDRRG